MSQSVNVQPLELTKTEKQFYHDLLQHNEQVINQSDIQHHSNKKTTTLQYNEFIFKEHSNLGDSISNLHVDYCCKSRESGCNCKLVYYPQFNKWTQIHEHSHAPPRYYSEKEVKLCPERRRELFDWIYSHYPYQWDVNSVVSELNSKLSPLHMENPSFQVKSQHVVSARNKIIEMDKLDDISELTKGSLTKTLGEEEFVRDFTFSPYLNIFFSSPTQLAVLEGISDCDHLCIDVNFEDCPTGTTQFISVLVKKPNLDAYPILFTLTRSDRGKETYERVWKFLFKLCPSLTTKKEKLNVRIEQFGEGIYQGTRNCFPNTQILGDCSNWLQSINRWINHNRTVYYPIIELTTKEKLFSDLQELSEIENIEQFHDLCEKFVKHYSAIDGEFTKYMENNYLRSDAIYPPQLWALSKQKTRFKDQSLDSSIKKFHKKVNSWFKTRPSLKKAYIILQRAEYLASIGKLYDNQEEQVLI